MRGDEWRGSVYLAGPIRNCDSFDEAVDWREMAATELHARGIHTFSPMRAKDYLKSQWKRLNVQGALPNMPLSSNKGIVTRDRMDVNRVDLMLAYLVGSAVASVGTCIEFGWADAARIPIVTVIEPDGDNPHRHAMLEEIAGYQVETLMEAVGLIDAIIG